VERLGLKVFDDQQTVTSARARWRWVLVIAGFVIGWAAVLSAIGFVIWGLGWLLAGILNIQGPR
jgi:hypothetical protein